ncbi:MAG TPA: AAA family ATPase [Vicinamibacterales bacterium]|nr:AAA family ATPase [Vicinamibacterales bacterium]
MSSQATAQTRDTSMYEQYYGFVQPPFTLTPDPRFLYRSESHEEAITLLQQAIRRKEGFIVLTGDIGTGKTTSCRALLEQLDASVFTSLILNPFLSVEELLREVLLDFGVVSREGVRTGRIATASKHELISTLHEFLLSLMPIHGSAVLIIDEAQHLTPQVLEQIRIISNLETNEQKLLQIVLVGQLNLLDVLAAAEMRQLDQRISIRATLKPLNREEVEAYIAHRLWVARGSTAVTFEPTALDRMHAYTAGVPRIINLLCDRSLMQSAQMRVNRLTPAIIEEAAASLGLRLPEKGRQKKKKKAAAATATAPTRVRVAGMAALVLALLVVAGLWFTPVDQLIDVGLPAPPPSPVYQPRYATGAKPIPRADLLLPPPVTAPLPATPRTVAP